VFWASVNECGIVQHWFAADCPFGCLGCRISLEMSGYGAMSIRMGRFEGRGDRRSSG
jgi:hypothetical protein